MVNQFQKDTLDTLGILYKNYLLQKKDKIEVFLNDFRPGGIDPETFFDTVLALQQQGFEIEEYDRDQTLLKEQEMGARNTPCCEVTLPKDFEDIYKKLTQGLDSSTEKISLGGKAATFDDDKAEILIADKRCPLPPFKNEHFLCKAIFRYPVNEPVDWSNVYEKMTGSEIQDEKKNLRTVQDAVYAINKRIQEVLNTDDELLTWGNKTVKRNF